MWFKRKYLCPKCKTTIRKIKFPYMICRFGCVLEWDQVLERKKYE